MVWEEIEAEENLDGLTEEQRATFRERAVPVPGSLIREGYEFTNDARRDIPATIIATGFSAADYQKYAREDPVPAFLAGLPELRNVTWIDLPTSHWPMWSQARRHRARSSARWRQRPGRRVTAFVLRSARTPKRGERCGRSLPQSRGAARR